MESWDSIFFQPTLLDSLLIAMLIAVQNLEWVFASLDVYSTLSFPPPIPASLWHRGNMVESCNLEKVMKWAVGIGFCGSASKWWRERHLENH